VLAPVLSPLSIPVALCIVDIIVVSGINDTITEYLHIDIVRLPLVFLKVDVALAQVILYHVNNSRNPDLEDSVRVIDLMHFIDTRLGVTFASAAQVRHRLITIVWLVSDEAKVVYPAGRGFELPDCNGESSES
jgi:hypothetical protein